MSELLRFFQQDRFAAGIGVEILEVGEGHARTRLTVEERHLNAAGVVQGGAVFTLADLAFACACNSRGELALSVSAHIEHLRGAKVGDVLVAEAREESSARRISTCAIRVTDGQGRLVALFTGTAFRRGDPIPRP
jgi:acyl-CoA thioesterase